MAMVMRVMAKEGCTNNMIIKNGNGGAGCTNNLSIENGNGLANHSREGIQKECGHSE